VDGRVTTLAYDLEAELAVLGAILLDPGALAVVTEILDAPDFHNESHRTVYRACRALAEGGSAADLLTTTDYLREHGLLERVGGASYLSSLVEGLPDVANAAHYAKIVQKHAALRRLYLAMRRAHDDPSEHELHQVVLAVEQLRALERGGALAGILMSSVEPEPVRWLWRHRIPLGKLTVIDGDPGLGKSLLTLDLAARVSMGREMPDGTPGITGGAGVVICSAEDGLSDTIRPRLELAGADLDRIVAVEQVGTGDDARPPSLPEDLPVIRGEIERVGARLLIVDPLMAYLSGAVDAHRDQDVRRALASIARLAEEMDVATAAIRHLVKTGHANPLYRGGGSIGIVGAARSGMLVAQHPEHEEVRVLAPTKSNLGPPPESLEYVVEAVGDVPRIRWVGASEQTARTLLSTDRQGRTRDTASDWLQELLGPGAVPAAEVRDAAEGAGFSWRTVRRAAEELGIERRKVGSITTADGQRWEWLLPGREVGHLRVEGVHEMKVGHLRATTEDKSSYVSNLVEGGQNGFRGHLRAGQEVAVATFDGSAGDDDVEI